MNPQNRLFAAGTALALLFAPLAAMASAPDAQVDKLTDTLVRMLPFGKVLDAAAADDPAWPLQEKADKVSPAQLVCLRKELSSEGYRRNRHAEVAAYAKSNPDRIGGDITLLEGGAASVFRTFIDAGVNEVPGKEKHDPIELTKSMSAGELMSFMTFIQDAKYAPLRELTGIGDAFDVSKSGEQNEAAGEGVGAELVTKLMLSALQTCEVPPSKIFE